MNSASTTSQLEEPATSPPAWFRAHRTSNTRSSVTNELEKRTTPKREQGPVLIAPLPVEDSVDLESSWWSDLRRFLRGPEGKAYGVSLLAHSLILLILSLLVIHHYQTKKKNSPLLAGETEEVSLIEEQIDTRTDFLKGAERELQLMQPVMETSEESEILIPEVQTDSFIQPESKGSGEEVSIEGLPFSKPTAGNVITKGNFSAWTVPADPAPFQSYLIIVQVKLPKSLKKYERGDLSGEVLGTDGYWQSITVLNEYDRQQLLPLQEGVAQLVIAVPGAYELVEDRINIKSARLNEEQTLKIEF
ncbi:MAG: hypothetical protein KDA65_03335 [Planctomycetaceae bacterium]|nr:hypothetical protein [Planctomycetaceae bacterium]